ncbi:hypothetical protein GCM10023214_70610 [Amycolatopsis dongchuanensis]|uniref:Transposase n=1 Tax=Amycolatopsis dongchuanensis TaxID=1070866 RepID=A0ABP8VMM8_9PSEU
MVEKRDQALVRHRAALESGADPQLPTRWMVETQVRRAETLPKTRPGVQSSRLSRCAIRQLVTGLNDIRQVLTLVDPDDKAEVYPSGPVAAGGCPCRRSRARR